jgi:hypothetical protein
VFPCNSVGEVIDYGELPGSFRGTINHYEAISGFVRAIRDPS